MLLFRSRSNRLVRATIAFLWPKKGFIRGWTYIAIRILRLRSSDYSLAAGFAAGVFASMTPFLGFHFVIAAGCAWLIRGNVLVSLVGTFAGNPWTIPLFWVGTYTTGSWLLGVDGAEHDISRLDFALLLEYPGTVLVSMVLGSFALGLPAGALSLLVGYVFAGRIRSWLQSVRGRRARRRKGGGGNG